MVPLFNWIKNKLLDLNRLCCYFVILHYTRLIPFWVLQVNGAHLHGFAPRTTHQGCNSSKTLAMCERFDKLGIRTPYLPHQRQTF